jgi:hypothetical protein
MKILKYFLVLITLISACSPAASATPSPTFQAINPPASSTQPPPPTSTLLPSETAGDQANWIDRFCHL